jgi:hypothetical protein
LAGCLAGTHDLGYLTEREAAQELENNYITLRRVKPIDRMRDDPSGEPRFTL